ncbi:MAG: Gfo/Idh/MocA family protein [Candidatus Methanodesulfokora sp.]|jgi:UDP-N-acetylglucosamine 3-dehydrogenase
MRRAKVGVIGCGWFGTAHARVYREIGNVDLVAVSDINLENAKRVGEMYNARYYGSPEEMLEREELDAVSIVVTPQYLTKIAILAAENGINMLVEKPVATNRQELEELVSAVERSGIIFMPGFIEIFNPAVEELRKYLKSGEIGEPLMISSERMGRNPKRPLGWNIGVSLDLGVHEMYVQMWLMGQPTAVRSVLGRGENGYDEAAVFILSFPKDALGVISTNWLTPAGVRRIRVSGSRGSAWVDYLNQTLVIERSDHSFIPQIRRKEPLLEELQSFINSVIDGRKPDVNEKFARDVLISLFSGIERGIEMK